MQLTRTYPLHEVVLHYVFLFLSDVQFVSIVWKAGKLRQAPHAHLEEPAAELSDGRSILSQVLLQVLHEELEQILVKVSHVLDILSL